MSSKSLDNKEKQSQNNEIDSFDKKSLANSVSLTLDNEEIKEENLFEKFPIEKEKEKKEDLSSESSKNDKNKENDIINLNSNSSDSGDINFLKKQLKEKINKDKLNENNIINNKEEMEISADKTTFIENDKEKVLCPLANYISKLDKFDKDFSKKIHDFTLPKIAEHIIYLFARMFNPDLITSYFIIILSYKSLNNEPYFILKPILSTIANLVFSLALKKYIGRPRPETSKISSRIYDLRKHEKNCSMPSGDSIQAGNWAILIYLYSGYYIGFLFVPFVMYARIYFYCHYLFDTIIGALFGIIISLNINILIIYFGF